MNASSLESPRWLLHGLRNLSLLAGLVFLAGLFLSPERTWTAFLVSFSVFVGLSLSGPFFLALLLLSRGRWPGELRRILEAMSSALPVAALLGIVFLSGVHTLYEWSHAVPGETDVHLAHKAPYLNVASFAFRLVACFLVWITLARWLIDAARRQDASPGPASSRHAIRISALFVAAFAVTFSVASIDWIQSLEPHWSSTIFALVILSDIALAGLCACIFITVGLRQRADLRDLANRDRVEDLGRLMIGFSLFWAYISYCQHMLIWYTNLPEETSWFHWRAQGGWLTVGRACFGLCWLVPMLAMMSKKLRRNPVIVARTATAVVAGVVLHFYYLVAPPMHGPEPRFGPIEIVLPCGALAGFFWITLRSLGRGRLASVEPSPPLRVTLGSRSDS